MNISFLHFFLLFPYRYCGEKSLLALSSQNNTLEVKFHSDESYTDKGFRATFVAYDPVNRKSVFFIMLLIYNKCLNN